ncbi:unnamed protein product [Heterosigma akashiwo]
MKKTFGTIEKAVPKNPRFSDVESKIDTGLNANNVRVISAAEYLKRQDELFFRLTPTQMMNLFAEYEVDGHEEVHENTGGWDGPRMVTIEADEKPQYQRPYIIFDLREIDEYRQCHILQARNHPFRLLNQDKMSAEMYQFKNKDGHLIILYDNDTSIVQQAAHVMCTRGFDNIYILSGGLYAFSERHPQYVEGVPPVRPASQQARGGRPPLGGGSRQGSARSTPRHSAGGAPGTRSSVTSKMTDMTVADSVIMQAQSRKTGRLR